MRRLASVPLRLFLVCWALYGLFFATNIVREHYPAFTLIDRGDWVCDEYQGWHADIFVHTDGHSYVGNNVLGSLIAAGPLFVFDPLLDRVESWTKQRQAADPDAFPTEYDTKHPNRQDMFRRAVEAGKHLRLGASAVVTSIFLMAPLCAWLVVLVWRFLARRGTDPRRAVWIAFLFAFATPVFYRAAHLNHNVFLMATTFGAWLALYVDPDEPFAPSLRRRLLSGLLCGACFALDYAGAIPAAAVWLWFVLERRRETRALGAALRESVPMIAAGLPGLAFLLGTQWAMYGDAFKPGQFVMRPVNYTDVGLKGITLPSAEVFLKNLVMPGWGLYAFAPLLLIALWPVRRGSAPEPIFPRRDRRFALGFVLAFLVFNSMNQYSMMQFNSGFRYLLPIVPFALLQASDRLARMRRGALIAISVLTIGHGTVLSMMREVNDTEKDLRDRAVELGVSETELPDYWRTLLTEAPIPMAYRRLVDEGPQLPWLAVFARTSSHAWLRGPWVPIGLILAALAACRALWCWGGPIPSRSEVPGVD